MRDMLHQRVPREVEFCEPHDEVKENCAPCLRARIRAMEQKYIEAVDKSTRYWQERDAANDENASLRARVAEKMGVKEAVETIAAALESDPGYRISWQANIAMQFVDEMNRDAENINDAANRAADNFLKLLCYRASPSQPVKVAEDGKCDGNHAGPPCGSQCWNDEPEPCFRDATGWCSTHTRQSNECGPMNPTTPPPAEKRCDCESEADLADRPGAFIKGCPNHAPDEKPCHWNRMVLVVCALEEGHTGDCRAPENLADVRLPNGDGPAEKLAGTGEES